MSRQSATNSVVAGILAFAGIEILGGWAYVLGRELPPGPMFEAWDAEMSAAGIVQWHYRRLTYPVLLDAKSGEGHRQITKKDNDDRASFTLVRTK